MEESALSNLEYHGISQDSVMMIELEMDNWVMCLHYSCSLRIQVGTVKAKTRKCSSSKHGQDIVKVFQRRGIHEARMN